LEGLRDSITENQNGWLVEPENAKAYADKIIGILERPSLARNMGENAKSFCYANFSWQNIANRYISTLNING
jgi:glycosyltransferase involved in cell wall biosynthesis